MTKYSHKLTHLKVSAHLLVALLCFAGTSFLKANAETKTIIHSQTQSDPKEALILKILKLAVAKSGTKYSYEEYAEPITAARMLNLVRDGNMSIMWAGTQIKYEEEMYPIRIPVLKGLLGHRVFIIRKGDQFLFDNVKTFSDFQKIPLGQGRFWGDTAVLKNAGMNVIDPVKYASIFYMLEGGRFDYFPRAIHEPWSEIAQRRELNLTVEENLLLIYPLAMYFFVSRDNMSLARDIERGFRLAIEDGSYDEMFFSHPMIKEALENANLKERTIYRLANPNLNPKTPIDDKSLWLNIDDL
jgi:hypothetical protein